MSYLLRRLIHGLMVLWAMSLLVFLAIHLIGNPVDLLIDPQADAADRASAIAALGLDKPLPVQYGRFLAGVLQGDLGTSFRYGESALGLIFQRLPATLELALLALLIALTLALPLGLWAAARGGWAARLVRAFSLLGFSLPTFWVGLMLILLVSVQLAWLPPGGRGETRLWLGIEWSWLTADGWQHLLLPALTLALFKTALLLRLTQQGAEGALKREDVRFARSRGISRTKVLLRHVLPQLAPQLITVGAMEFGGLIAFAVVTETVFAWPGMGKLLMESLQNLDRPVVVAYLMVVSALFVFINLLADLLCLWLDPRLSRGEGLHD